MNKVLFLLGIMVALASCKTSKKPDNRLLGDWVKVEDENQMSGRSEPLGMTFYEDSVDYLPGYFGFEPGATKEGGKITYLGNFTEYKFENDTLSIFNKSENRWESAKINKITADTLVLQNADSSISTFVKKTFQADSVMAFDKVIVSSSGCMGSCPVSDIIISKDGSIAFSGEKYNEVTGYYKGKLSQAEIDYIFNKFSRANINALDSNYTAEHTDDETINTTFVKDGRILKTIFDYGKTAPAPLVWAYNPARYAYLKAKLEPIKISGLLNFTDINLIAFTKEKEIFDLQKSERFWLWNELRTAKVVDQKFDAKYSVKVDKFNKQPFEVESQTPPKSAAEKANMISAIKTDGRYYQLIDRNGKAHVTLDLGYNFLEDNFKNPVFRPLDQWGN